MANENKEIGEIVKKCKILLLDIEGTTTSISFVKDKLFPYAEENVKQFLDSQWETDDVKEAVTGLRKLALEDQQNSIEGVIAISGEDASKEDQIVSLVNNVKWQMSTDRKVGALKLLQGLIWKQGYDKGDIKGHVYDDVSPALQQWRSVENQKVYIYSSGSVQAQKLLFGQSEAGDLLPHINGHFDTSVGAKQETASYKAIAESIGCKAEEILFLTDILKEAQAAREAGLHVALVSREGNAPLPDEASAFPLLHSLAQLTVSYKRKTDPQDEQPAKVLKVDADMDVKSNSDDKVTNENKETIITEDKALKTEKMDVEDETVVEAKKPKETIIETMIEEITESTEPTVETVCDAKPVIIEISEEDIKAVVEEETEVMDAKLKDKNKKMEDKNAEHITNEAQELPATVTKEESLTVVTEIEELSNDKQPLGELGEIIDDIEPMVEEPDELQNVGEVLEKECDEILSKVQNVTNLENITVKPLLNTITEEAMETETTDSNDIVDRILETELELQNEQLNTVTELEKLEKTEKKNAEQQISHAETIKENLDKNEILLEKAACDEVKNIDSMEVTDEKLKNNGDQKEIINDNLLKNDIVESKEVKNGQVEENINIEKTKTEQTTAETSATMQEVTEKNDKIEITNKEVGVDKNENLDKKETTKQVVGEDVVMEELKTDKVSEVAALKEVKNDATVTLEALPCDKVNVVLTEEVKNEVNASFTEVKSGDAKEGGSSINEKASKDISIEKITSSVTETKAQLITSTEVKAVLEDHTPAPTNATADKVESSMKEEVIIENMEHNSSMETKTEQSKKEEEQHKQESENKTLADTKLNEEKRPEPLKEAQVNGKATTNGDSETVLNGNNIKDEELSSRLSVENGKEVVNGSNGEATPAEQGQGDSKVDIEVVDIKVKTVTTEEPRTDPIEQPTEA